MPNAYDPRSRQLKITHSPTARQPLEIGKLPELDLQFILGSLRDQFIKAIKDLTGIDLSSFPAFIASLLDHEGIDLAHIPVIGDIVQAITGLIGGGLPDLTTFFTNLRGSLFSGIDFLGGGFSGPTAIAAFIDNLTPAGKLAQLVSGKLKAGQEPQKLLDILTGTLVDAAQIGNLANIGAIAQSKITGLVAKLTNLDTSGNFDASALINITNIPAIAQSKITGLTTALGNLLPTATWQSFLDSVKGSGGGVIADVVNRLQKLNGTTGEYSGPLNALNITGVLDGNHLSLIHGGAITDVIRNALIDGNFDHAESLASDLNWSWDSTVGYGTLGSAKVVAAGYLSELQANQLFVTAGHEIHGEIRTIWNSLSYTGSNPIALGVTYFKNGQEVGGDDLAFIASPAATNAAWDTGLMSFTTIIPDITGGIDEVRLRPKIGANLTSGTVNWGGGILQVTDSPHSPVSTINEIVNNIFGLDETGWGHTDAGQGILSQVGTILNNSNNALSMLPQLLDARNRLTTLETYVNTINPGVPATVGKSSTDDFERSSSSTLGAGWDENYGSGNGSWALDGHNAYWELVYPNGDRESLNRKLSFTMDTDYQTISVSLASRARVTGFNEGHNDVIGRCDATESNYIRFRYGGTGSWSLSKYISGSETVMASGTTTPGATVMTLICGDKGSSTVRDFTCKVGATVVAARVTDSTSVFGSSNRQAGFGGRAEGTLFAFGQQTPGKVAWWTAYDT